MGGQGTDKRISGVASGAQFVLVTVHDDDSGGGGGGTVTYKVAVDTAAGGTWTLDLESDHFYQGVGSVHTYNHGDMITINATAYDEAGNGTAAPATIFGVSEFGPQFAEAETIDNVLANYSYSATNLKVGDFNGDGFDDFAGIYRGNSDHVRLFYSDGVVGSTNLGGQTNKSVGSGLDAMDVGDVTGDGIDDIVAMNSDERLVVIQGDGTQQSTHISELPTSSIYDMLLFDYDGDGDQDLAIANTNISGGAELHVYTNDGNGNFVSGYSYEVGQNIYGLAKADFDGGGKEDLIFTTSSSSDNAHLLISTSTTDTPSFNAVPYAKNALLSSYGEGLLVDYLGADTQKLDVVVGDTEKFTIFYDMEETGVAASSTDVYYSGGGEDPRTIELMDYDGDGNKDIIAIYQNSGTGEPTYDAAVFLTNDTGQITESFILVDGSGENYAGAAILDYNNDGIDDILITNQTNNQDVMVLRGGAALQAGNIGTASGPTGVNQLNAESASSNASLALRVDASTMAVGQTIELFDPSGNSIFSTTTASDGSGGVQGLSGDYLTITLDSAAMTALSALGDGNHNLRVDMADVFQNTASTGITIEQASTVPAISVADTVLNENSPGSISDDSVQITGTSTDADYILVTVADDGGGSSANTATYKVTPDSSGTWTLDLDTATPQGGNAITTDNGDIFSVTASAHGTLNNTGTTATANDYLVDLFAPTLIPQYVNMDYSELDWGIGNNRSYYYTGVSFSDVNGDGNLDMALTTDGDQAAGFFYGKEGGTFDNQADVLTTTRSDTRVTEMVDLDGNGYDDMLIFDRQYIYTILAKDDGSGFETTRNEIYNSGSTNYLNELRGVPVNTGDFNGDGHMDFSFTNSYGNEAAGGKYVFMGNGTGTSFDDQFLRIEDTQYTVQLLSRMADIDNDGDADMVYFKRGRNSPWSHYLTVTAGQNNTGTPLVQNWSQTIYTGYDNGGMTTLEVADLNGDGWQDIAFTYQSTPYIDVYLNTQGGHYSNSYNANSVSLLDLNAMLGRSDIVQVNDMELTDIDGDGDTDMMLGLGLSGNNTDEVVFLTQNADGSFSESLTFAFDDPARTLSASYEPGSNTQYKDFNGDGVLDIFMYDSYLALSSSIDPRVYWGHIATIADGGSAINQDQETLTVALGDATSAGDTLVVTYNGATIGTATASATDVSNGSMDITLDNVADLYHGGRNLLTFTISDALGGTNSYLQSMEVNTPTAQSNSYILHFDGEADTLTSFTAGDGAGGDKMNISQLLNDAGYTGTIDWSTLESGGYISRADDGSGNTIISVDKDGSAGTTHNLQHIVTLNNVTASNLDDDDIE